MGGNTRKGGLVESLKALNESAVRSGPAAMASYTLIGAIVMFAGLGYALDSWLGTSPWLLIGGLAVALLFGFLQLALVVWRQR